MNTQLSHAVADALVVLDFASRRGLSVPADDVAAIVGAASVTEKNAQPAVEEVVKFWLAMSRASKLIHPATVESIKATAERGRATARPAEATGTSGKWGRLGWLRWWDRNRAARAPSESVRHFLKRATIFFVLVGIAQIYTGVGAHILSSIDAFTKEVERLNEQLLRIVPQAEAPPDPARESSPRSPAAPASPEQLGEMSRLNAKLGRLANRLALYFDVLHSWNVVWQAPLRFLPGARAVVPSAMASTTPMAESPPAAADEPTETDAALAAYEKHKDMVVVQATFALDALQTFILPFLYGALGACLYILLDLGRQIEGHAFSSDLKYRMRLWLGCLAGVAMGWVAGLMSDAPVKGLTPQALAFVAGYSVDILISILDRFVAAFSVGPRAGG